MAIFGAALMATDAQAARRPALSWHDGTTALRSVLNESVKTEDNFGYTINSCKRHGNFTIACNVTEYEVEVILGVVSPWYRYPIWATRRPNGVICVTAAIYEDLAPGCQG
jgi:hypothetical protein